MEIGARRPSTGSVQGVNFNTTQAVYLGTSTKQKPSKTYPATIRAITFIRGKHEGKDGAETIISELQKGHHYQSIAGQIPVRLGIGCPRVELPLSTIKGNQHQILQLLKLQISRQRQFSYWTGTNSEHSAPQRGAVHSTGTDWSLLSLPVLGAYCDNLMGNQGSNQNIEKKCFPSENINFSKL